MGLKPPPPPIIEDPPKQGASCSYVTTLGGFTPQSVFCFVSNQPPEFMSSFIGTQLEAYPCAFMNYSDPLFTHGVVFTGRSGDTIQGVFVFGAEAHAFECTAASEDDDFPLAGNIFGGTFSIQASIPNNAAKLMYDYNFAPLANNLYEESTLESGLSMRGIRRKADKTNVLIINDDSQLP